MNEVEFLRRQLAAERRALAEVAERLSAALSRQSAQADPAAPPDIATHLGAGIHYLFFATSRATARQAAQLARLERLGMHVEGSVSRIRKQAKAAETYRMDLARLLEGRKGTPGASNPEGKRGGLIAETLNTYTSFILRDLIPFEKELEALSEPLFTSADWRAVAQVDADSILEERRLRAAVTEVPA